MGNAAHAVLPCSIALALGCLLMPGCRTTGRAAVPGHGPFVNAIGMALEWLPAGYWVGRYEVTQDEYTAVMDGNPSTWVGTRRPVENVDWKMAAAFCERLTDRDVSAGVLPPGWRYNLPSEKQWEHFVGAAELDDMVCGRWHGKTALGTMPVGSRRPNQHGLYDVRGNVWEWCREWWDHKRNERVLRGGSWDLVHPEDLQASYRPVSAAVGRDGNLGFRVVLQEGP